ncbi:hypothetical protein TWF506_005347 [Arthrobotrys conoides]|uniref:Uncharacterized protein n=1 Tax=Arthrobotrys conoides TaxID=74498 RepID=A0AAN8RPU9_9PEZI
MCQYHRMKKCGKHRLEDHNDIKLPLQSILCDPACYNIIKIFFRGFACEECRIYPRSKNLGNSRLRVREHGSTAVMLDRARSKDHVTTTPYTNKLIEERANCVDKNRTNDSLWGDSSDSLDGSKDLKSQFWDREKGMVLAAMNKNQQ